MSTLSLGQVAIDSARADELAGFWSRLLDRPLAEGASAYFAVLPPDPTTGFPSLMFLAVPEEKAGKNRLHLDLSSVDLAADVERAVSLGAAKLGDFDEHGTQWTTLTDPEGNVFDIGLAHDF